MSEARRETLEQLAERLLTGEPVLAELFAESLRLIDDEAESLTPVERAFLDEVRFAYPELEEGHGKQAACRAREGLLRAARAFVGRGPIA